LLASPAAGFKPSFRLAQDLGAQVSVKQRGRLKLIAIILPENSQGENELSWDEPTHVYDVRAGKYLGRTNTARLSATNPPKHIHLLALQSDPITKLDIECPPTNTCGGTLTLAAKLLGDDGSTFRAQDRVLRLDVANPDGNEVSHYRQFLRLTDTGGTMTVPFAFNDPEGTWTLTITDVATGVSAARTVKVLP
jgi:hypothetical protein